MHVMYSPLDLVLSRKDIDKSMTTQLMQWRLFHFACKVEPLSRWGHSPFIKLAANSFHSLY